MTTMSTPELGLPTIEQEFRKIQPILTELARGITGQPIKVVPNYKDSRTQTDGSTIFLAPPSQLAIVKDHMRSQCGRRGSNFQMLCPECLRRESILCMLMHEIGHITGHSFQQMEQRADTLPPTPWLTDKQRADLEFSWSIPYTIGIESALQIGELAGEFFKTMLMGCEDIRIEAAISAVRPATEEMLTAAKMRIITNGTDHSTSGYEGGKWTDFPLNFQVICALGFTLSNVEIVDYMDPLVIQAMQDKIVQKLNRGIPAIQSVQDLIKYIIPLYGRLIELGFFEGVPQPEPEPESEQPHPPANLGKPGETGDSQNKKSEPTPEQDKSKNGNPDAADSTDGQDRPEAGESGGSDSSRDAETEPESGSGSDSNSEDNEPGNDDPGEGVPESEAASAGDESSGGSSGQDEGDLSSAHTPDKSGSSGADSGQQESSQDGMAERGTDGVGPKGTGTSEFRPASKDDGGVEADPDNSTAQRGQGDITGPRLDGSSTVPPDSPETTTEQVRSDSGDPSLPDLSDWSGNWGEPESEQGLAEELVERPDNEAPSNTEQTHARSDNLPIYGRKDEIEGLLAEFLQHDAHSGELDRDKFGEGLGDTLNDRELKGLNTLAHKAPEYDLGSVSNQGVAKFRFDKDTRNWICYERSDRIAQTGRHIYAVEGETETYSYNRNGELDLIRSMQQYLPSEQVLGTQLQRLRVIFQDNKRARYQRNLKSGRVNPNTLGKRAAIKDPRLFRHKDIPGKRDYEVAIYIDCSGSTSNGQMDVEKRAVMAQAELLSRLGIPFTIVGHSGTRDMSGGTTEFFVELFIVKTVDQPWNDSVKVRLAYLPSTGINLDGHALQCALHILRGSRATDKILMYYTDGSMPNSNYKDEKEALLRGIAEAKRSNITLMAVGVKSDSPIQYGMDTVVIEDGGDVDRVVAHLSRRLAQ